MAFKIFPKFQHNKERKENMDQKKTLMNIPELQRLLNRNIKLQNQLTKIHAHIQQNNFKRLNNFYVVILMFLFVLLQHSNIVYLNILQLFQM